MPTYRYRCLHCHAEQSESHGMTERPAIACAACGGLTERVIGAAPTVLGNAPAPFQREAAPEPAHECHGACVLHRPKPQEAPHEHH